eukprot:s429_g7.t1
MAMWSTCSLLLVAAEPRLEARRAAVEAFLQRPKARRRCDLVRLDARKITGEAVVRSGYLQDPARPTSGATASLDAVPELLEPGQLYQEVWLVPSEDQQRSFRLPTIQRGDVWQALREAGPLPLEAEGFDARPILSVGVKASSTRSHQHAETYQLLLSLVAGQTRLRVGQVSGRSLRGACHGSRLGATCNLEAFVLGFGAQGLSHGWPALHRAAHSNDLDALQRLVEDGSPRIGCRLEGVNLNQRHDQVTPLQRAVTKGHLAAVQRLVAAGAKLRLKDREGPGR